jgi:HEAT repeat protein
MTSSFFERRSDLLQTLQSSKAPRVRAEAAYALCEMVDNDNREVLSADVSYLVTDTQLEVRCAGLALAASTLPLSDATALLARNLTDSNARVRVEAAGRLADLTLPETRAVLTASLEDSDFRVRFEAARGIAHVGHAAGAEVLIEGLQHPDFRFRAAEALTVLNHPSTKPALLKAFSRWFLSAFERTQLAIALAQLGEPVGCAHLKKRARPGWRVDRAMALEALGKVKCAGAFEFLSARATDPNDSFRGAAVRALGHLGDVRALPLIRQLVPRAPPFDDHWVLDVAQALTDLGDETAAMHFKHLTLSTQHNQKELDEILSPQSSHSPT